MVKIKLQIDPRNTTQVAHLNALLISIGAAQASTPMFLNHNPNAAIAGIPTIEDDGAGGLNIFAKKLAENAAIENATGPAEEKPKRAPRVSKVAAQQEKELGEIVAKEKAENDAAQEGEPKEETKETPPGEYTIEHVREMLGKKVNDHRETIKAKLTALGAKNVSVLDASHYDSFYQFMKGL